MKTSRTREKKTNCAARGERATRFALSAALVVITLATFYGVLNSDFAGYDDEAYVVRNDHIKRGVEPASVLWALRATYASNWHPLTWLSHMLDYSFFEMDPMGHHLTSLAIHCATVLLLFWVLSLMTGAVWRSAFVAALFAVHPLHVESVAFVAERKDVLGALFWMLTMLAYTRWVRLPSRLSYGLVLAAFALGLMAKPMPVSLPIVLLLLDYWPLERLHPQPPTPNTRHLLLEKIPLFAMSAASCVITFIAQSSSAVVSTAEYPIGGRIANAIVSYAGYLCKMIWPAGLSFFYPYNRHLPLWQVGVSAAVLVGITLLVSGPWRGRKYMAVGWLWYLITLLPVIGLVQVGEQSMADRYTYIPLIGVFVMIAWGFGDLAARSRPLVRVLGAVGCIIILALAFLARAQVGCWKNEETLLRHAIRVNPNNSMAHYNLGVMLSEHGRFDEAVEEWSEAVRSDPKNAEAHNNLGLALGQLGLRDESMEHLRLAVRLDPKNADAQYNLGNALTSRGDCREAIRHFRKALELDPAAPQAHQSLAVAYYYIGDYRKAWDEVRLCIKYGGAPAESFVEALSLEMPEP